MGGEASEIEMHELWLGGRIFGIEEESLQLDLSEL